MTDTTVDRGAALTGVPAQRAAAPANLKITLMSLRTVHFVIRA
ncbi:hypothetical protein [Streptomyces sp. NPDC007856]